MTEELQILFEQFLSGKLNEAERQIFQSRLESNEEFSNKFSLYKEMSVFMSEKVKYNSQISVLREVGESYKRENQEIPYKNYRRQFYSIVLAGLLLLFIYGAYQAYSKAKSESSHQYAMTNYRFPKAQGTRSIVEAQTKLDSAILLFDLRRMEQSKELFESILKEDSSSEISNRYLSHIYFHERNYTQSYYFIEQVIDKDSIDIQFRRILEKL